MSSPLPASLRMAIKDAARDPESGLVQCAMCKRRFPDESIQVDHIIEEADGGSHDPVNLQPLCAPKAGAGCHRIKSRKSAKIRRQKARETSDTNDRPGWLVGAGLSLLGGGVAATSAWLATSGGPVGPFLQGAQTTLGWGLLGAWGAGAYAAVRRNDKWALKGEADFAEPGPDEQGPASVRDDATDRLRDVLDGLMGAGFTIVPYGAGSFRVGYSRKVQDQDDSFRYKIQERVNAKMQGRWRLTWNSEDDWVLMAPRPELPGLIRHPGPDPAGRPWSFLPIAPNTAIDLTKTAHVLIIGRTGAGKTALIRSAIIATAESAARGEVESILLDPKRIELIGFRGWPGVRKVVTTDEAMWDMPLDLVAEMEERYRLFEEEGVRLNTHKPRIVICDEYEDYVKSMQAMWTAIDPETGKPRKVPGESEPPPIAAMAKLLRKARKCNIHIIIGTQRPDSKWFGGGARDNCECRIIVGSPSVQAIRMAFERADVGRDIPADLKGRFTIQNLDGEYEEDQGWYVADPANADGKNTPEDEEHLRFLRESLEAVA